MKYCYSLVLSRRIHAPRENAREDTRLEDGSGKEHYGSVNIYSSQLPKGCKRESGCLDFGAGPRQPCIKLWDYIYYYSFTHSSLGALRNNPAEAEVWRSHFWPACTRLAYVVCNCCFRSAACQTATANKG